jgi:uncharacterized protein YecT (DUF1311 family)
MTANRDQPELPFLTPDQAATLEGARAAIERAQQKAWMGRRNAEADELGRIGDELIAMLEANATAIRQTRHPSQPRPT